MSVAQDENVATVEDLRISESLSLSEATVDADGTILAHLIRPCVGNGRGKHLYEADMLEQNAGVFTGWKSYANHLSETARRALGGLPRDIRDLAGIVKESWWDGSVPPNPGRGFGQGAVVGRIKMVPYIRELVESDPALVELSINGDATSVRPVIRDGQRVSLVEGIRPKGSVDFVTEAGAGGRVVALMEATTLDEQEAILLDQMTTEEFKAYVAENRPELLEGLSETEGDGDGDGETGGDEVEITPDALREAFATEEGQAILADLVAPLVLSEDEIQAKIEEAVADERDLLRAEAEGHSARQIELRDLRDNAHTMIAEAKLPGTLAEQSKARFDLKDGVPSEGLDVLPELDDDGNVVKSTGEVLAEAVAEEIKSQREVAQSLAPATRVRGQGPTTTTKVTEGGDEETETPSPLADTPRVAAMLQEAGFDNPEKVYS